MTCQMKLPSLVLSDEAVGLASSRHDSDYLEMFSGIAHDLDWRIAA